MVSHPQLEIQHFESSPKQFQVDLNAGRVPSFPACRHKFVMKGRPYFQPFR